MMIDWIKLNPNVKKQRLEEDHKQILRNLMEGNGFCYKLNGLVENV